MKKRLKVRREELLKYLQDMEMNAREAFALACGTSHGQLMQVAFGTRSCSAELAVAIDRESGRALRMEVMFPEIDWNHVRKVMRSRIQAAVQPGRAAA